VPAVTQAPCSQFRSSDSSLSDSSSSGSLGSLTRSDKSSSSSTSGSGSFIRLLSVQWQECVNTVHVAALPLLGFDVRFHFASNCLSERQSRSLWRYFLTVNMFQELNCCDFLFFVQVRFDWHSWTFRVWTRFYYKV